MTKKVTWDVPYVSIYIKRNVMTLQEDFLAQYDKCHDQFARYCHALAVDPEDAKDLMSESILRAFENFEKLKNKEAFGGFLVTIARRIYLNQARRNKFKAAFSPARAQQTIDEAQASDHSIEVRILYEALDKLPRKQKEALILFEISGFTLKDICEIQTSGLSAVKARLARGRKKLTTLLTDTETKQKHQKNQSYETAII